MTNDDVNGIFYLHEKAMLYEDIAIAYKLRGDFVAALSNFEKAFSYENKAVDLIARTPHEPMRSIVCCKAAHLAIDCGKLDEAERLIKTAHEGIPTKEIESELNQLNLAITSQRKQCTDIFVNAMIEIRNIKEKKSEPMTARFSSCLEKQ